jgi:hypothetical protein
MVVSFLRREEVQIRFLVRRPNPVDSEVRVCYTRAMNEKIFKGQIAQLKVELRAAEKGITLSKPLVDARYDYIVDNNGTFERVQVKYAGSKSDVRTPNSITVPLRKWSGNKNNGSYRKYTTDEVDALLVYIPRIEKIIRVDKKEFCGKCSVAIHLGTPASGQQKGILLASKLEW